MNTELLLYIALSVALFIVSIYVAGLVLGIPKLIRYQKVQSLLLLKIAKKLEVDDKELERIVDVVDSRLDVPAQNTNAPFREIAGLKR